MALGKKTGGRNFQPGQGGRRKGSRDQIPRTVKASIRAIFEELVSIDPQMIRAAILQGLKAAPPKSFPYLQLAAYYVDGRPTDQLATIAVGGAGLPEEFRDLLERVWQAHLRGVSLSAIQVPDDPRLNLALGTSKAEVHNGSAAS